MFSFGRFDEISLGTVGFAQVGRPDYHQRIVAEKAIINGFFHTHDILKIPEEFNAIAYFKWKQCPHDFGMYWDFTIQYQRDIVDDWEDSEEEDEQEMHTRFWNWANQCEGALGDHEEILYEWCQLLYQKDVTMTIVHKRIDESFNGLKQA